MHASPQLRTGTTARHVAVTEQQQRPLEDRNS